MKTLDRVSRSEGWNRSLALVALSKLTASETGLCTEEGVRQTRGHSVTALEKRGEVHCCGLTVY